jgi:putative ATP-dependent endonuclease of OLD family
MKRAGMIHSDLSEARVSVINVGGTSQLRYAKIFLRAQQPELKIPVAVVADIDAPPGNEPLKSPPTASQ